VNGASQPRLPRPPARRRAGGTRQPRRRTDEAGGEAGEGGERKRMGAQMTNRIPTDADVDDAWIEMNCPHGADFDVETPVMPDEQVYCSYCGQTHRAGTHGSLNILTISGELMSLDEPEWSEFVRRRNAR